MAPRISTSICRSLAMRGLNAGYQAKQRLSISHDLWPSHHFQQRVRHFRHRNDRQRYGQWHDDSDYKPYWSDRCTNAHSCSVRRACGVATGDVFIRMSVLIGDTTGNGQVNSTDISQTKAESGHALTNANFREDVTVSGSISSSDVSLVKSHSRIGFALSDPPGINKQ